MSLSEGHDTLGEVAEDDQGGVLLSPSEEGTERAGVTAIGFERASGMNEERRKRPALSGEFSKRSFALAMSPRRAHLFFSARFGYHQGKQEGPSYIGVTGTVGAGGLGFFGSQRGHHSKQ